MEVFSFDMSAIKWANVEKTVSFDSLVSVVDVELRLEHNVKNEKDADKLVLSAWWLPKKPKSAKGVVKVGKAKELGRVSIKWM